MLQGVFSTHAILLPYRKYGVDNIVIAVAVSSAVTQTARPACLFKTGARSLYTWGTKKSWSGESGWAYCSDKARARTESKDCNKMEQTLQTYGVICLELHYGHFGQSNTSWRSDIRTPESLLKNTTVALKEVEKAYGPAFSHTEWSKTCIVEDTALHPLSYHLCCLWSLNAPLFCLPAAPAWAGLHHRSRSSKNEMFHPTVVGLYLTIQTQTQKLWCINKT